MLHLVLNMPAQETSTQIYIYKEQNKPSQKLQSKHKFKEKNGQVLHRSHIKKVKLTF